MATITRGAVILTPKDVLGWSLAREGRSVVHQIIGDPEPDVTQREPGLRAGSVRALWPTHDDAQAAADALGVVGGPWTIDATQVDMVARVVGTITVAAETEHGGAWSVTFDVQEITP